MKRRHFLGAAAALAVPAMAWGQTQRRYRVAWLSSAKGEPSPFLDGLREGLRDHGYVEGRNLSLETHWAAGSDERAVALIRDIEASRPDVIVAQGPVTLVLRRIGTQLPVIFGISSDPVEAGLIESLPRPGRNFTGVSFLSFDLVGKRMELLKELLPRARRVGILARPQHPGEQTERAVSERAARSMGTEISYHPVRAVGEIEAAFDAMHQARCDSVVVFPDAQLLEQAARIAALALRERLAAISGWGEFADAGLLMTYGPVLRESFRRLGAFVDKVLRGSRPADLPAELPTVVELVINARTAKALGLTIPASALLRANRVIE
jgi:putative ABC transport system substrate-binding protein